MADLQLDFDEDIFQSLKKLSETDELSKKMLEAACPVVVSSMKSELSSHKQTAELVNSVKPTKPKFKKNGDVVVVVRPTGNSTTQVTQVGKPHTRKVKVRNMEKLASLEFGNSHGQKPTPIIEKIVKKSEESVLEKMMSVYNKEVEL